VHAVENVMNYTDAISENQQNISYTSFHKASEIQEGDHRLEFQYGPENARKVTRLYDDDNDQLIKTRIYAGNYEKEILADGTVREYNYISGPAGLIAVYIVENGTGTLYYTVTDHLGSIVQLIDENGTVIDETNYGPWGRYRNPITWEYDNTAELTELHRGYTGHVQRNTVFESEAHQKQIVEQIPMTIGKMLPEFDLIHMNGRMYSLSRFYIGNPALARMLSPDNYVQDPENPQNYNRYAYCYNNPLKYTDPDGELPFLIPVAIGAAAGYYFGSSMYMDNYNIFNESWWQGQDEAWKAGVSGAIVGGAIGLGFSAAFGQTLGITGMSVGTSGGIAGSGATTPLWNITSNAFITGSINTLATGLQTDWDPDQMYKSGLVGMAAGAIGGSIASGKGFNPVSKNKVMTMQGIKTQNYFTNILSGAGDRMISSMDADLSTKDVIKNTFLGGIEGAIAARMFSSDKMLNFGRSINELNNPIFGRYFSGFISNSMTANPGASLMAARIYGSVYPTWKLGQMNNSLYTSISTTLAFSPFFYIGLSKVQKELVGTNYPYAYDIFDPNY